MQIFFDFDEAERRKKEVDSCIEQLKSDDRDVYIFGAGEYANKLNKFLTSIGVPVKGFFVDDRYAGGGAAPISKIKEYRNFCLVFGVGGGFSQNYYEKIDFLKKEVNKCDNSVFFVSNDYWLVEQGYLYLNHEIMNSVFLKQHFNQFKQTYEMLADDLSKRVMTEYLYTCVCRDASKLAQLGGGWDYEYDLERLFCNCGNGLVIECGAFDGKTISQISAFTKNNYEMIALECDQENYRKCCERVAKFPNIKVLKLGAWDKKAKLAIVQLNSASSFLKEVDNCAGYKDIVEVTDVDSLANSKRIAILIMDIEGSEMKALKGAQNAIKNGANLAIRVYHKKEDLITIPQYIKSLNANYKFYIRFERGANQCRTGVETTLYAICE